MDSRRTKNFLNHPFPDPHIKGVLIVADAAPGNAKEGRTLALVIPGGEAHDDSPMLTI
jgi:hypothetical protein